MKFTGHERDLANPGGPGDDLDYMHARHESPVTGRFLSVDPEVDLEETLRLPQKWNRYSYARENPLKFNDPTGNEENTVGGGVVVNSSNRDVTIAFDAEDTSGKSAGKDMILTLHQGESSTKFTPDADAVLIEPGQNINGKTSGAFKISVGAVEITNGSDGKLVLSGNGLYFAMKSRDNPEDRSGYQPASQVPPQWKLATKVVSGYGEGSSTNGGNARGQKETP